MFEFLSAKLRCVRLPAKWFSMSSGDFFDEILKKEIIYNNGTQRHKDTKTPVKANCYLPSYSNNYLIFRLFICYSRFFLFILPPISRR